MQYFDYNEQKRHGTSAFPFEFYHVDQNHTRYIMNYHWHVEYEIIRILKGSIMITLDEKQVNAVKGDIIFVHSGVLHSGTPAECVYECLVFDMHAFSKNNSICAAYMQKIRDRSALVFHHFAPHYEEVGRIINNVFDAMYQKFPGYELTAFGELYHFFGLVFSEHLYLDSIPQTRRDTKRILQLKKVLDFIETNYSQPISLEQMAGAASMSPKYFCRFFYQMTRRTPVDYLNSQRIEHACYLLNSGADSVTDVAYTCGFNDLSYFIKTFKRYKGITPGKYL